MTAQTILPANSVVDSGYDVANSVRFNDDDGAYMHKTPDSAGNRKTWTFSCWSKKSESAAHSSYFGANNSFQLEFHSTGAMLAWKTGGDFMLTNALFRDTSAWYHIVWAFDTTQGTAANRVKLYINGTQVTSWATASYPDEDAEFDVNNAVPQYVGDYHSGTSENMDGYLAEVVFIDGLALAADQFGEFDSDSGIWKPIDVSGLTFGTNGFYLEFKQSGTGTNASGMGADTSGEDNHFAVNNLTAVDQSTDTCTNNFATLNPLDVNPSSAGDVFTEGNLKLVTNNNSNAAGSRSTIAVSSGKWYAEVKYTSATAWNGVAAMDVNFHTDSMGAATISWYQGRTLYIDGTNTANWGSVVTAGDIVGIALDMDNNRVTISQGGQWWDTDAFDAAAPTTYQNLTSGYDTWGFMCRSGSAASTSEWNFGAPMFTGTDEADGDGFGSFEYAVPSGYFALCSKNLAEYG